MTAREHSSSLCESQIEQDTEHYRCNRNAPKADNCLTPDLAEDTLREDTLSSDSTQAVALFHVNGRLFVIGGQRLHVDVVDALHGSDIGEDGQNPEDGQHPAQDQPGNQDRDPFWPL